MARQILAEIGHFVKHHQHDILMAVCMALVAWSFFNIGKMHAVNKDPITVRAGELPERTGAVRSSIPLDTRVVVSRNSSSMKYHYSWCGSGQRIKPENQVWFETVQLAEQAGYSLAGNCR